MENYTLFLIPYIVVLIACAIYGGHRYILLAIYYRNKKNAPRLTGRLKDLPVVTVQLPVFNEQYVVERLIDSVCALDYPREKLEVQVLDDSTDETVDIARARVEHHRTRGVDIHYIHRENREGFKAGALDHGLTLARGEFVAIFDADFVVEPDMLLRSVHYFHEPDVGMVQARWGHINRDYSLLTRCQAIFLDGHFQIEHAARNRSGRFMSFNGTAGIWRRTSIEEAGGWQHDTLTEDLDLSYRAQLAGWRFVFLDDLVSPAELPMDMNGFKSQQHRWTKGAIQTAKKLLIPIFKSDLPLKVKIEAFFHLTSSTVYLYMTLLSLLLFPAIVLTTPDHYSWWQSAMRMIWFDLPLFLVATCSTSAFYMSSQREIAPGTWLKNIRWLPFLMALGIGISLNNALAVIEALIGHKSEFVRTPKHGVQKAGEDWRKKLYRGTRNVLAYIEIALGLGFAAMLGYTLLRHMWPAAPFVAIFSYGFLYTGLLSVTQWRPWAAGKKAAAAAPN
jgi:cellulose synthase/poly-beta-1,6-N-acetylglucosamine synthase-like glycosyltransferase